MFVRFFPTFETSTYLQLIPVQVQKSRSCDLVNREFRYVLVQAHVDQQLAYFVYTPLQNLETLKVLFKNCPTSLKLLPELPYFLSRTRCPGCSVVGVERKAFYVVGISEAEPERPKKWKVLKTKQIKYTYRFTNSWNRWIAGGSVGRNVTLVSELVQVKTSG